MAEDTEKMVALKKACSGIILSAAKEAAARVLAAERKAFQLQRSLAMFKEESLAVLLRLKAVMESKIKEAEKVKLSQARKIEDLEAQLCEANDIIGSLRSEMKVVNPRLEIRRNHPTAVLSKENGEVACMLNSGLIQAASYQRNQSCKCCFIKDQNSVDNGAVNPELASNILKNGEPDHYLNGCTQQNFVFEHNLLPADELPARSHDQFSKIDTETIEHQIAEKVNVLNSTAAGKTVSMMPSETNEVGLLSNASGNGNSLRYFKQYGRRKVLRKEVTQPIPEVSSITGKSISLESLPLELKEVDPPNNVCGNHNLHGVHDPSLKRRRRKYIVGPSTGNSIINGKPINMVNIPRESKELNQLNSGGHHKILGHPDGNGRRRRWIKHIMEHSDANCAIRDRTFCLVNVSRKSKRVDKLGKLCGNGNKLRFWSRCGRPRKQRKHMMKPLGFGTSATIANRESSDEDLKKDKPSDMNHKTLSGENTHTKTIAAPQETLKTCLENAEILRKGWINLKESPNRQISGLPTNKRIMTEEIVMSLCSTSSKNHISSSSIVGSKEAGEDDDQSKPLVEIPGSMIEEHPADKDIKQDTGSEKTVESKLTSNCEIIENLLNSEPTGNHEADLLMGNIKPRDSGEADRTAQTAEAASSRASSCVIKYTYRKKRKRVCFDSKNKSVSSEENSAWKVPKESTQVDAQNSDLGVETSSRDSRKLAQVARQLISLSEKRWW